MVDSEHYYHLTAVENVSSIQRRGLKARKARIFLFTDLLVANVIAKTQVFVTRYAVFEVARPGISGRLEPDTVAEFSHPFQRILRQSQISPKHLRLLGIYDTVTVYPTEWDYLLGERLGKSRPYVENEFAAQREYLAAVAAGMPEQEAINRWNKYLRQARTSRHRLGILPG